MHGSHNYHEHSHSVAHVAPPTQQPLARMRRYIGSEVVRPIVLNSILFWSTTRRHLGGRNALKRAASQEKASYASGDAARITWLGAAVNLALAIFKVFAGVVGHSAAMMSDAGHSFSDLISDALTLITLNMSQLPPDDDHPYGHGRFESLGSLAIAGLLLLAGCSFGANAYSEIMHPSPAPLGKIALVAALASIVSKEFLFRATERIGEQISSPMLIANAWHHRSDALSSVVALAGVGGAMLGVPILDPLAGLVVAGMVTTMGVRIGIEAVMQLSDTSDLVATQSVHSIAREVPGVQRAWQVRARSMGGSYLVDLAIQVESRLSASAAHKVAEEVRWEVLNKVPRVSEVLVHVDTAVHDVDCPLQTAKMHQSRSHIEVEEQVRGELRSIPEFTGITSVLVHYLPAGVNVDVQATMLDELRVGELVSVADRAKQKVMAAAPDICGVRLAVDLQPEMAALPTRN
eukprot:CAMPEP_0119376598 /NCGR_PEP_ID=MMETSP1334-20130426/40245_1 /TAXON_ID=127549 /ORGANISM="Calcidiscus leptoporus, Strain RCC1130" /LENGTH=461 /DNA_ID=CAMNT_0007395193 /DNA_START=142 /DNA_END=1527 /DNA_ORIENTATION=-